MMELLARLVDFIGDLVKCFIEMVLISTWLIALISVFILVLKGFLWILRGIGVGG